MVASRASLPDAWFRSALPAEIPASLPDAADNVHGMDPQLRLMTVHAHPDDEASKGAGTVAKYSQDGVRCVLVCCTDGGAGDILNPAMDTPENKDNIVDVRRQELARSAEIIGYDRCLLYTSPSPRDA